MGRDDPLAPALSSTSRRRAADLLGLALACRLRRRLRGSRAGVAALLACVLGALAVLALPPLYIVPALVLRSPVCSG